MTPEELEQLVLGQGAYANIWVARAFDGMPESERAALAPTAQQLFTDLAALKPGPKTSPVVAEYMADYLANLKPEDRGRTVPAAYPRAAHAVVALCPLNWASKPEVKAYVDGQALPVILQERKPTWLTQWLEADYRRGWTWGQVYADTVLKWIAAGICTRPAVDEFTARVAYEIINLHSSTLRGPTDRPKLDFVSLFRARPELIDYVPDFFRIDCEAFKKDAATRRDTCGRTFTEALVALSQSGELDRDALIDLTFEGLAADKVLRNSKSGMIEFLALLGATPHEKAARQDRLFALLQSPVPQVRTFAINEVAGLEKAGVLDAALAAQEVPLIFSQEGKSTAIAALKLLDRMAKQAKKAKASPDGALAALVEGLRHASEDVQGKRPDRGSAHPDRISVRRGRLAGECLDRSDRRSRHRRALRARELSSLPADEGPSACAVQRRRAAQGHPAAVFPDPSRRLDRPARMGRAFAGADLFQARHAALARPAGARSPRRGAGECGDVEGRYGAYRALCAGR
ncbi:MAG: hypothetical protein H2049_04435 [Porphyrobacter sp.]|nr:hypothetical protein [Porphyrobacter sp.]